MTPAEAALPGSSPLGAGRLAAHALPLPPSVAVGVGELPAFPLPVSLRSLCEAAVADACRQAPVTHPWARGPPARGAGG